MTRDFARSAVLTVAADKRGYLPQTFPPPHLTMERVQNTGSKNYGISNFYTWTGELIILKLPSPSSVPQFIIQLNSGFLVALNPITTRNKIGNIKM